MLQQRIAMDLGAGVQSSNDLSAGISMLWEHDGEYWSMWLSAVLKDCPVMQRDIRPA